MLKGNRQKKRAANTIGNEDIKIAGLNMKKESKLFKRKQIFRWTD
jgi:hypothetical protein